MFQYSEAQRESFYVCHNISYCLETLKYFDDIAIGASRQHILNCPTYLSSTIFCFDESENIANYKVSLLVSQQFNRTYDINHVIRRIFEADMLSKWYEDSRRREIFEPTEHIPIELTFEQFAPGIVFGLLIGLTLSFLAFVCEHIIRLKLSENNGNGIWIYLEHFFDGKRHYLQNLPERIQASRA